MSDVRAIECVRHRICHQSVSEQKYRCTVYLNGGIIGRKKFANAAVVYEWRHYW